ncbi:anti-sigma factor family protein [Rhodohalobacter mucosus]|uniref:Uncharacterized protein n=1 Tax=Rhodohalobacter mucosus TaxID=2079485 RepID=A0A316TN60_9BACT|nr:hypothetical protein [Rhodohalobacter mucosus]PWN05850.1 hypothetical protein DDZ15_11715 [Rhodohalobacter mucosus]
MNKEETRNRLMDYLYDEMESEERAAFEKQLSADKELQNELNELKSARSLFSNIPYEAPSGLLFQVNDKSSEPDRESLPDAEQRTARGASIYSLFGRGLAAAAILLIGVFITAFAGIEFGKTESGFYLTIGEPPAVSQSGLSEEDVLNVVTQMREENAIMMAAMLDQAQAQQNEQLEEAINILTTYYEDRRQQDLMLISEGFNQLERDTYSRFRQTDETLGNLIYALSNP